jgi:putative cardiolipin synthase
MNFDPRSAALNSEMGVIVRSPGLGEALAKLIERDMRPGNSWQVTLDSEGRLRWTHDTKTVRRQPARNAWQRVEEFFFRGIPQEYY